MRLEYRFFLKKIGIFLYMSEESLTYFNIVINIQVSGKK